MSKNTISVRKPFWQYAWQNRWLYFLLLPGLLYFVVYKYLPMFGLVMVFQDYKPMFGILRSAWIGFRNFERFFEDPNFMILFRNTLILASLNLVLFVPFTIVLALLLNEVKNMKYKRFVQTVTYLPHFFSWIVIASLSYKLLSSEVGMINGILKFFGRDAVSFLASEEWFRTIIVVQGIWRDLGWGSIIFLAAISAIDVQLYEVAIVEGANRLQCLWYVTLPSIKSTISVIVILRLGRFLDLGFEQIYVQLNSMNRDVGQIFDTYIYSTGILGGQFSYAAAIGMFKSVIGVLLVIGANYLAHKTGDGGVY
jgi:putative aldouronate transport system permease protein